MTEQRWYTIKDVDQLDTPALVIYPHRVKQNIDIVKNLIDDVYRLRPHVKTHKNSHVTQLMLDAGITKFKCATIAEAEMLGMANAPDVLLAYQPGGPKIKRLILLILTYPATKYSCLIDNQQSAKAISDAAIENDINLNVFIDLDVGMHRTGIIPDDEAVKLYKYCAELPGITPIGLHAYDGHIHDADLIERTQKSNSSFAPVLKLQAELKQKAFTPIVVSGSTPTYSINAARPDIECSPGTFVYWDRGYQSAFIEEPFLTAALIVARVISLPTDTTICIDCGHKSIASESELSKRIFFLNAPELKMKGHSEEHLVADAGEDHQYNIGDVLYGLPWHVCPTVALYERAITIENNIITGEWLNIARDRIITI
ncbi:D-TA family PLP-dependent enzyme [Mucilaginibacter sp.]